MHNMSLIRKEMEKLYPFLKSDVWSRSQQDSSKIWGNQTI